MRVSLGLWKACRKTASSLVFTVGAQEKPRLREFRSVVRTGGLSPISLNFVADFRTRTTSMEGWSIRTSPSTEQGSSLGRAQGVADLGIARSGMRSSGTPPKRPRLQLSNRIAADGKADDVSRETWMCAVNPGHHRHLSFPTPGRCFCAASVKPTPNTGHYCRVVSCGEPVDKSCQSPARGKLGNICLGIVTPSTCGGRVTVHGDWDGALETGRSQIGSGVSENLISQVRSGQLYSDGRRDER